MRRGWQRGGQERPRERGGRACPCMVTVIYRLLSQAQVWVLGAGTGLAEPAADTVGITTAFLL